MATALAAVEDRDVVRCDHCQLVQFKRGEICVKCRTPYAEEKIVESVKQSGNGAAPRTASPLPRGCDVAEALKRFRTASGISQRQFAKVIGVPRTYVSKIENRKAIPTITSIQKFAKGFKVTERQFVTGNVVAAWDADELVRELRAELPKLTSAMRSKVLDVVRNLSLSQGSVS